MSVADSFWLASFLVPGWAQLMLARWSGVVWLMAAAGAWSFVLVSIFIDSVAVLPAVALVASLHLISTVHAYRLARRLSLLPLASRLLPPA